MPVLRIDNYLDGYRIRARAQDVHEMAARPDKKFLTEFENRRILDAVRLHPGDVLVDIGCGDASLLRMAPDCAKERIGIVSTGEEKQRLLSVFPGLTVKVGTLRLLPLESGTATKIVCNAVLAYLRYEDEVKAGLQEIARIACPGAMIWIGGVPDRDEYRHYGMYRGNSMVGLLYHLLRRNGMRSFLGMIRRWLKAIFGDEQIVLNSAGMFYASPERMISLAESCGLRLQTYSRPKEVDQCGNVTDAKLRYDYAFTV